MSQMQLLKTVDGAKLFKQDNQKLVLLENVRLSYPALGAKRKDEGEDGKVSWSWRVQPLLDKHRKSAHELLMEVIDELKRVNEVKIPSMYLFIKDGDETDKKENQGNWTLSVKDGNRRPVVRNEHAVKMFDMEKLSGAQEVEQAEKVIDEKFYGGCWADVLIRPWYFSGVVKGAAKTYPKRICGGLVAVKFVKDDTPFGQGAIDDSNVWGDPKPNNDGMDDDDDL